jgi:hypothetical protein
VIVKKHARCVFTNILFVLLQNTAGYFMIEKKPGQCLFATILCVSLQTILVIL